MILLIYCWICFIILLRILASYIHQEYLVQFSCSVMSDSLGPHGLQHARLPCLSTTPRACSNSCPSSWWCHPAISSSVFPFSHLRSFPASVLPVNIQDWFPLWTGWISLQSKGLSRVFSNTTVQKHQFFVIQLSSQSNSHIHTWPLENHSHDRWKTIALTTGTYPRT